MVVFLGLGFHEQREFSLAGTKNSSLHWQNQSCTGAQTHSIGEESESKVAITREAKSKPQSEPQN